MVLEEGFNALGQVIQIKGRVLHVILDLFHQFIGLVSLVNRGNYIRFIIWRLNERLFDGLIEYSFADFKLSYDINNQRVPLSLRFSEKIQKGLKFLFARNRST